MNFYRKKLFLAIFSILLMVAFSCNHGNKYKGFPEELAKLSIQIDKHPKDANNYYLRAKYYYQNRQAEEGLQDIQKAIELKNDEVSFYILLADLYFAQKETDLTEETLQKAISIDPKSNEVRLKLAELYFHLGQIAEAESTLQEAINLQPHNPRAQLIRAFCCKANGDTTGYLRMLQLTIDQDASSVRAYLEIGYYYQQQLNPIAIQYYHNALKVEPNNLEINYNLAKLYQDLGEIDPAEETYNIVLQIDPNHIGALNNLGFIRFVLQNRYEEAIVYFDRILQIKPTFLPALANRGNVFIEMKEYDKARQDFQQCLSVDPNYETALKALQFLDKNKK
ncbi:MAG: tetratricopeptide repeat protein [Bacteroidales bacterium]|jgi:Tfp pilus assembly protein PilF|nr:tetratricopeptide repeat protein [Bacteroidales bacterium]